MDIELKWVGVGEPADIGRFEPLYQRRINPQKARTRSAAQPLDAASQHHIGAELRDGHGQNAGGLRDIQDAENAAVAAQRRDLRRRRHRSAIRMHMGHQRHGNIGAECVGPTGQLGRVVRARHQPYVKSMPAGTLEHKGKRGKGILRRQQHRSVLGPAQRGQQLGKAGGQIGLRAIVSRPAAQQTGQRCAKPLDRREPRWPGIAALHLPGLQKVRLQGAGAALRQASDRMCQRVGSRARYVELIAMRERRH